MRPLASAALLGLLIVSASLDAAAPPRSWTPQQRVRLKERADLEKRLTIAADDEGHVENDEAIKLLRASLVKDRLAFGADSAWLAAPSLALADRLEKQANAAFSAPGDDRQRWKQSVQFWQEITALRTTGLNRTHWRVATARVWLAHSDRMTKLRPAERERLAKAEKDAYADNDETDADVSKRVVTYKVFLQVTRELLGENNQQTAWLTRDLAAFHDRRNEPRHAEHRLREAVALYEAVYGRRHPFIADAWYALGNFLSGTIRRRASEAAFRTAFDIRAELLGETDPQTLAALHQLGLACAMQEKYDEAERLFRDLLDCGERGWTPDLDQANRRDGLLSVLEAKGDKSALLAALREQSALLNRIARQDEYAEEQAVRARAIDAYKRTVALGEKGLPADDWRLVNAKVALERLDRVATDRHAARYLRQAASLDDESNEAARKGRFREAADAARRSLVLRQSALPEDHPDLALSLNNLGLLSRDLGDLAAALDHLRRAYELRKTALGENHPGTALCLNNLGQVYVDLGRMRQAADCLKRSEAILNRTVDHRSNVYLDALNNLGVLTQRLGDFAAAEALFVRVLDLHERSLSESYHARSRRNSELAGLSRAMVAETRAAGALTESDGAAQDYVPPDQEADYQAGRQAAYLGNLGRARFAQRKLDEAKATFEKALAIYDSYVEAAAQSAGDPYPGESIEHATALNSLALLLMSRKDYRTAGGYLGESLIIRAKQFGEKSPQYAIGLNSKAALEEARGNRPRAIELLRQALAITRVNPGESSHDFAITSSNLALVLQGDGKVAEALPHARRAALASMTALNHLAGVQTEEQQLTRLNDFRGHLDHFLSLTGPKTPEDAYAVVLAWKGVVFTRQRHLRERGRLATDREALKLRVELDDVTRRQAALEQASAEERKAVPVLAKRREELKRLLAEKSPEARERLAEESLTPARLRASLPADIVLIDYLEYNHIAFDKTGRSVERRLTAFVVRRDGITRFDLGPAKAVREAVSSWREVLGRKRLDREDPAVTLHRLIWEPLAKELKGAKGVIVSPDGALAWLPFAALPGRKEKSYLIEDVAIATVAVPQALPALIARKQATGGEASLLVVGDVDYDGPKGTGKMRSGESQWSYLPGTRSEMLAVRDSFEVRYQFPDGQTRVLRGARATESSFRRFAPEHRFLHVATHGFFEPGRKGGVTHPGMLSGLVVSGANREPGPGEEDGVLTALEVAEMDLSACELAVLSACETGLGKEAGGEGLLGLQRAFQVAGARSVVSSLWKVDDLATEKLMTAFYRIYWDEKTPVSRVEALRQAQLTMLREGGKRGMVRREKKEDKDAPVPPFYWAAFVLSGEWR